MVININYVTVCDHISIIDKIAQILFSTSYVSVVGLFNVVDLEKLPKFFFLLD